VASFASGLASSAKVGCSLAVRIWIIGAFLYLVASTAIVGSEISHAQKGELKDTQHVPDLIHDGVFVRVVVK
jgi:hypothetical protein